MRGRFRRILVVEDSAVVQAVVKDALRKYHCEVQVVGDGVSALDTIKVSGEPDFMLLDINLPRMNGLEVLGELREQGLVPRVPVIIVSTEGEDHDVARGLEAGARAYLRKPFRADALCGLIDSVMRR